MSSSLQRIELALFANDPINWQAAAPTAGQANPAGVSPDADYDGLPDLWELANGLDPQSGGLDGGGGDPDNDGANNGQEYIAGTDPNDRLDYLHFQTATVSNQFCLLEFATRTGRVYAVEAASAISVMNGWTNVSGDLPGQGQPRQFAEALPGVTRYYRLQVRLAP